MCDLFYLGIGLLALALIIKGEMDLVELRHQTGLWDDVPF
jgi:hypothetical protein